MNKSVGNDKRKIFKVTVLILAFLVLAAGIGAGVKLSGKQAKSGNTGSEKNGTAASGSISVVPGNGLEIVKNDVTEENTEEATEENTEEATEENTVVVASNNREPEAKPEVKPEGSGNSGNSGNGGNTGNTGNSGNGGNAGNTGNPGNSGNSGNTGNSGNGGNTGNTGNTGNAPATTEATTGATTEETTEATTEYDSGWVWVVDREAQWVELPVYEMRCRELCNGCGMDVTTCIAEHFTREALLNNGCGGYHSDYYSVQVGTEWVYEEEQGHWEPSNPEEWEGF